MSVIVRAMDGYVSVQSRRDFKLARIRELLEDYTESSALMLAIDAGYIDLTDKDDESLFLEAFESFRPGFYSKDQRMSSIKEHERTDIHQESKRSREAWLEARSRQLRLWQPSRWKIVVSDPVTGCRPVPCWGYTVRTKWSHRRVRGLDDVIADIIKDKDSPALPREIMKRFLAYVRTWVSYNPMSYVAERYTRKNRIPYWRYDVPISKEAYGHTGIVRLLVNSWTDPDIL